MCIADDEAHLRDLMQMELPRLGHEVTVCPDGASAVKALEKGSFDAAKPLGDVVEAYAFGTAGKSYGIADINWRNPAAIPPCSTPRPSSPASTC